MSIGSFGVVLFGNSPIYHITLYRTSTKFCSRSPHVWLTQMKMHAKGTRNTDLRMLLSLQYGKQICLFILGSVSYVPITNICSIVQHILMRSNHESLCYVLSGDCRLRLRNSEGESIPAISLSST